MRKIVLFIAALLFMAVPVMAVSNVHINCSDDDVNMVTVSYVSDHNLIRAFGLDITTDTNKITQVVALDPNYRIYPGQIVIVGSDVNDYGTCYDPCDLGDANVTIEMGSLYTMDSNYNDPCDPNNNSGYLMQPGLSGTLLKFYVGGDCNYVIAENAIRGGIVMEDPTEEPNVTLCSGKIKFQLPLDFGDAPESYVTSLPNGPRHTIGGPRLGANIDAELNGAPSIGANGDDIAGIDDEDGVVFNKLVVNEPANSSVTVTVSQVGGILNGWIDWGNDGSFAQAIDYVIQNVGVGVGQNILPIAVPAAGVVKNTTLYSRWRISTAGSPDYYGGPAADGEVEDHYDPNSAVVCHIPDCVNDVNATAQAKLIANGFTIGTITTACSNSIPVGNVISTNPVFCNYPNCGSTVNIVVSAGNFDFGDAPNTYLTTKAVNGPNHIAIGPMLGNSRDTELDGQPNPSATGDDIAGIDDENGVQFWGGSGVRVTVSAACKLNAWVDFNNNGNFADAGEQIFTNTALTAGSKSFVFTVPAGAVKNTYLISRWRVTDYNLPAGQYYGAATNGEVEDYNKPYISDCYGTGDPNYTEWVANGRPYCWCYPRQCHGDADGKTPQTKAPYQWVTNEDLTILKSGWIKTMDQLAGTDICADFDRKSPQTKAPFQRVTNEDLTILKKYWLTAPDPNCVPGNRTPPAPPME